jgi:hypothetical protein
LDLRHEEKVKRYKMKENISLVIASLLSVFFVSVHIAGDIILGFDKGDASTLIVLPVLAIWSYATLVLTERKWGYIIIIIGSLLGLAVPIVHMIGSGLGKVADSHGAFFFVWTTTALGVTSILSILLSIRGLLKRKRPI